LEDLYRERFKAKGKSETWKILAWGEGWKWAIEYAVFFNILAPMAKMRNRVYKGALKV
jgi:hypothetical protein